MQKDDKIWVGSPEWLERKKEQELEEARREAEKLRQAYIKRRETK
jgi:hypothetical protein